MNKKNKLICVVAMICLGLLIMGCTSIKHDSFYSGQKLKAGFPVRDEDISVKIDHFNDREIASQICDMVEMELSNKDAFEMHSQNRLVISINQRSFREDKKNFNSIFIRCKSIDVTGKIIAEKSGIIISDTITMVSAAQQEKFLMPIIKSVLCKSLEKR